MDNVEIFRLYRLLTGKNPLEGIQEAINLMENHPDPLVKARSESILVAYYFGKGKIDEIEKLGLKYQTEEEQKAIRRLLPFYRDHEIEAFEEGRIYFSTVLDQLIFLPVTVNGKPGRFLFDTGAMATVINEDFLPLEEKNTLMQSLKAVNALGEEIRGNLVKKIKEMTFAGLKIKNKECMILKNKYMRFPLHSGEIIELDGIIGYDILKDFAWQIDFKKQCVRRIKSKNYENRASLYSDFFPLLWVEIRGKVIPLGFDSGSNQSILVKDAWKDWERIHVGGREKMFVTGGNSQKMFGWIENEKLKFDGRQFVHKKIILMEKMAPVGFHFKIEGIIGADAFENRVIEIDFPGERLHIGERH